MTEKEILLQAVAIYGADGQLLKLGEELCECAAELFRYTLGSRRAGLASEIADVQILMEQLPLILGEHFMEEVADEREKKLFKLATGLGMVPGIFPLADAKPQE